MKDELENLKQQIEGYKALIEMQRSEIGGLGSIELEIKKTKNLLHGYKKVIEDLSSQVVKK